MSTSTDTHAHEVELFFDGLCPLCSREINLMKRLDRRGRIRFTDIAAPGFAPPAGGPDAASFMARIHARDLQDGSWIEGVEVFRKTWGALGLRWVMPLTRVWGVRSALDWAYERFAANRLRLTGRCDDDACQRSA
jgi:predicted DCC family thiol-disulfide oxidoreductase YuxK